ncbi:MAG: MBL fold metallo-hydrolase [Oscillospiraceae bacterium]|nr:MBL fold metallo-hydrolase [Oscillospiraceae bacterium]
MSGRKSYTVTKKDAENAVRFAKKYPVAAAIIALAVVLYLIFGRGQNTPTEPMEGLYLHCIDVGQGDCELIACGGEYMLVDAGHQENGRDVVRYLEELGVTRLEYVVCSHSDADHCGGLDCIIDSFEVGEVFVSPYDEHKPAYEDFEEALDNAGLSAEYPDMSIGYPLGDATVKFVGPLEDYGEINENSLVMLVEYGGTTFFLGGDVGTEGENAMLDMGISLDCDVLKVSHHGSVSSTGYRFLYEASPEIAVICCGKDNRYGHPHDEILSRLEDADTEIYRTDLDGTVIIFSDGIKVERKTA